VSDSEYRGGTTAGSKWGGIVVALICAPLFFFLMIADALGDCAPDTNCKKGFLLVVAAPTAIVGLMLFFIVRSIVKRVGRSRNR
jgi:hypothetical protein